MIKMIISNKKKDNNNKYSNKYREIAMKMNNLIINI